MSDFNWLCVWDNKGNMITHYEEINDNERHFSWMEDNRLEAVFDDYNMKVRLDATARIKFIPNFAQN